MSRSQILRATAVAGALVLAALPAPAQVAPAAPAADAKAAPAAEPVRPDDKPTVKIGGTLFTDFTYTALPESRMADGRLYHPTAFSVGRAYVNVTGTVSHLFAFRITPDIVREAGSGSSISGSITYRLKYAYAQLNLDEWLGGGSWVRLGMQQTPWIDFSEGVYRYRFQGPILADREGYLSSSDLGVSARYQLPREYGDVHAGVYNGEGYARPETNDQKAFQVRATLRPFPHAALVKGLRLTGFYDADHVASGLTRSRFIVAVTFEHPRLTASAEMLTAEDRPAMDRPQVEGRGFSVFLIPKLKVVGEGRSGFEALFRYDDAEPNRSVGAHRRRVIAGLACWFPLPKGPTAAVLADVEHVDNDAALARPDERRFALHALLNF